MGLVGWLGTAAGGFGSGLCSDLRRFLEFAGILGRLRGVGLGLGMGSVEGGWVELGCGIHGLGGMMGLCCRDWWVGCGWKRDFGWVEDFGGRLGG
jgi:hypothetical protein